MNDDTFSRNEARMVQFHRSSDRVAAREMASGSANIVGARSANDSGRETQGCIAEQFAEDDERRIAPDNTDSYAYLSRAELRSLLRERDRQLELAWRELADLRAAQSAEPTGAHPYRSTPQTATAAPSRPVVTSDASGRGEGRPGAMRRVYGALRACAAPLAGLGLFWFISPPHAPTWVLAVGCATAVTLTLAFRAIVFRAIRWLS